MSRFTGFSHEDRQMLVFMVNNARNTMLGDEGFTEADEETVDRLSALADMLTGPGSSAVVVGRTTTADESEVRKMLRDIVLKELDHWVPDASQRLVRRAMMILGLTPFPEPVALDHGDEPGRHVLVSAWVAGLFVRQCSTCGRLFRI